MIQNVIVPAFLPLYYHVVKPNHPLYAPLKKRYYFFWGGRGSGKSYQVADYIISEMRRGVIRVLCGREVQKSMKQSVQALLSDRINDLGLASEFKITATEIRHARGSECFFSGLQDHTIDSIKSYQGIDIFWGEEAHSFTKHSLSILLPTIRKDAIVKRKNGDTITFDTEKHKLDSGDVVIRQGSHFIFTYNRYMESDPIHIYARRELKTSVKRYFELKDSSKVLEWTEFSSTDAEGIFINAEGNQHFPSVLEKQRLKDYADDPEEAAHTWGGEPIGQAAFAIFKRQQIRDAITRSMDIGLYGRTYIGIDVARYGDDKTIMYKRRKNKVLERREYKKLSTGQIFQYALELAEFDKEVQFNIDDTGIGGGLTDRFTDDPDTDWRVNGVNFAQNAGNPEKYDSVIAEMIFNIRDQIEDIDMLDIPDLTEELTMRTWYLTKKNKRAVESKKDFKKRLGRSCDDMDAFMLAFYEPDEVGAAEDLGNIL